MASLADQLRQFHGIKPTPPITGQDKADAPEALSLADQLRQFHKIPVPIKPKPKPAPPEEIPHIGPPIPDFTPEEIEQQNLATKTFITDPIKKRLKSIKEWGLSPAELPWEKKKKRAEQMRDEPGIYRAPHIEKGPLPDEQYAVMRLAKEIGLPGAAPEDQLQEFKEEHNVKVAETPLKFAGKTIQLVGAGAASRAVGLTGIKASTATWGGGQTMEEISKLIAKDEELSYKQPLRIGKEAAFGAALHGIHNIKNIPTRIVSAGLGRGTWSTLEGLIRDKKITEQTVYEALFNIGLGSFVEGVGIYLTRPNFKSDTITHQETKNLSKDDNLLVREFLKARSAGNINAMTGIAKKISREGTRRQLLHYVKLDTVTKVLKSDPAINDVSKALVVRQLPNDIHAMPPAVQKQYVGQLVNLFTNTKLSLVDAGQKALDEIVQIGKEFPEAKIPEDKELINLMRQTNISWEQIEANFGRTMEIDDPEDIKFAKDILTDTIRSEEKLRTARQFPEKIGAPTEILKTRKKPPADILEISKGLPEAKIPEDKALIGLMKKTGISIEEIESNFGREMDVTDPMDIKLAKDILVDIIRSEKKLKSIVPSEQPLKPIPPKLPPSPEGLPSLSGDKLDTAETMPPVSAETPSEAFKLFEETEALKNKYAVRWGEKKGLPSRKTAGVYYPKSENIFVRSANNLSVAAHEIAHHIDVRTEFQSKIMKTIGMDKTGRPKYDPSTQKIRNEFTDAYIALYPGASKDHSLNKRMTEGFASVIEHYITHPTEIRKNYPEVVKQLIDKDGEYYDPLISEYIKDAQDIVRRYQKLDPLHKIMARMTDNKPTKGTKKFLTRLQRLNDELFDDISFIEQKLEKGTGIEWTERSPSLVARASRAIDSLITRNVTKEEGYWTLDKTGIPVKIYDFSIKTLTNTMKKNKSLDTFPGFLITRRAYMDYQKADKVLEAAKEIELKMKETDDPKELADLNNMYSQLMNEYRKQMAILKKDGFDRKVIDKAYELYKNDFIEETKMFDAITKAQREFLATPLVQKLKPALLAKWNREDWYAPMMREWHHEIIGEPEFTHVKISGAGQGKIAALMPRTGSALRIKNPVVSMIQNEMEFYKKGMRQAVYNSMLNIVDANPDMFHQIPYRKGIEKDPDVIIAMRNYKRVPLLVNTNIKHLLDEVLTIKDMHLVEKAATMYARMFVHGTTGIYPPFLLTNFPKDQLTLSAQTFSKTKPLIDPLRLIWKNIFQRTSPEAQLWQEFLTMGGERLTLQRMYDSPFYIQQEYKGLMKVLQLLDTGMSIASIPNEYAELITRGAEYVNARKLGDHPFVALRKAARVTAPFVDKPRAGGGTVGRSFMSSKPYLRSSLQAFKEHVRTIGDPKRQKQLAFTMAAITATMVGSLAYLLQEGSEQQKMLYAGLDERMLSQYIYYPCPWDKTKLSKIPIWESLGWIGAIINMTVMDVMLNANYTIEDYVDGITAAIPEALNVTDPVRMVLAWCPQMIGTAAETYFGYKTWPEKRKLALGLEHKPKRYQYYESTSKFAKWLGEVQHEIKKGWGLSPVQIDHFIEQTFGRVTRPFIGKNIGNPYMQQMYFTALRPIQRFYELHDYYRREASARELKDPKDIEMWNELRNISKLLRFYRKLNPKSDKAAIVRRKIIDRIAVLED